MSSPIHAQLSGTYTCAASPVAINIALPSGYDKFEIFNITDMGSAAANTHPMYAVATSLMPAGSANYNPKTSGAATIAIGTTTLSGGFSFINDSSQFPSGSILAMTTPFMSQAAPAVVTTASTATLQTGNIVRLTSTTGLLQVASIDYTIDVINSTTFHLTYLDTSSTVVNGGAPSAGNFQLLAISPRYYPARRTVLWMASAAGGNTLISMSVTHGFTVGQEVRIYCPAVFGMSQINGLLGNIVAIGTADVSGLTNTITVNINSASFTAFSWTLATSAQAAAGMQFAFVEPVGEAATTVAGSVNPANLLDDATRNQSFTGVQIGTTVQAASTQYQWIATKGAS